MFTLDDDLSWVDTIDAHQGDACPVRLMDGQAYVVHGCGAEIERLGEVVFP